MKNILSIGLTLFTLSVAACIPVHAVEASDLSSFKACVEIAFQQMMMPLKSEHDAVLKAQTELEDLRRADPQLANPLSPAGRAAEYRSTKLGIKSLELDHDIYFLENEKAQVLRGFAQICVECTEQERGQLITDSVRSRFPQIAQKCQ